MSWQTYVDDHLMCDMGNGQHLSAAAIIGLDGSVWAQSVTFPQVLEFSGGNCPFTFLFLLLWLDLFVWIRHFYQLMSNFNFMII